MTGMKAWVMYWSSCSAYRGQYLRYLTQAPAGELPGRRFGRKPSAIGVTPLNNNSIIISTAGARREGSIYKLGTPD